MGPAFVTGNRFKHWRLSDNTVGVLVRYEYWVLFVFSFQVLLFGNWIGFFKGLSRVGCVGAAAPNRPLGEGCLSGASSLAILFGAEAEASRRACF